MTAPYVAEFTRFSGNGASAEPAWLRETRRAGIEKFARERSGRLQRLREMVDQAGQP